MSSSLKDRVYAHVRSRIMQGKLLPGDRISHRKLAEEVGVSNTPAREAITQLISEGLVESHPRSGTYVSVLTEDDLREIYDLRTAIDKHTVEKLAGTVSTRTLDEVRQLNNRLERIVKEYHDTEGRLWIVNEATEWMRCDGGIHLILLCEAGNRRAVKLFKNMQLTGLTSGCVDQSPPLEGMQLAIEMHEALFLALENGDPEKAKEVAVLHNRHACDSSIAALNKGEFGRVHSWRGSDVEYTTVLSEHLRHLDGSS